jgi:cardiolipin synthase
MTFWQDMFHCANLISAFRILIAPVLFVFAIQQMETWFLGMLIFSGLTDVLDGYIARKLQQTSALGAHLDSWGDFVIYSTMAICAWILWPELTQQVIVYYVMILCSFVLPVLIGLIKFREFTGYHTWGVKIAVLVTFAGYLALYAGFAQWPFMIASGLCVIAAVEEILITLVLRHERTDVRSLWAAWQQRNTSERDPAK